MDEIGVSRGENELVHWCHGAPGVIYTMAAAHFAYGAQPHSKYLQVPRLADDSPAVITYTFVELPHRRRADLAEGPSAQGSGPVPWRCRQRVCIPAIVQIDTRQTMAGASACLRALLVYESRVSCELLIFSRMVGRAIPLRTKH